MLASGQEEIQKDYKAWRSICLNYLQIKKLKIETDVFQDKEKKQRKEGRGRLPR